MSIPSTKMNKSTKGSQIASKIPTSGRDSGTHSRSSSVSNLTTASDIHSEIGDVASDNAEDFKIDERVCVNGSKSGYIKFIGKTQFAPGIWAGVLLDEPVGKNDGSVAGVQYFTCESLRGIFTRPNKLTRPGDSASVGAVTPKSSGAVPSSRASVCSNASSTSPRSSKLRVGERVTVSSLGGLKPGTLRFVGETDFAKGEWAGIELDDPSGKNDGSVAGKRYFNCQMKYGLFAPLHKVSRAAITPSSRPGRSTPMMRSNSRDSLNSSVSTCSRASRVKLGITSLNSQKTRSSGNGVAIATKALQEAIKEKEQHIEQLLKERDLDRDEFARVSRHFEEISSELGKTQKKADIEKKSFEEQQSDFQRKLEDIQFQLEEEKIIKSDLEMQLQQTSSVLNRIEDFVSKETGEKFLNIKEILSGKEILSDLEEKVNVSQDADELCQKVTELESRLKCVSEERDKFSNQLNEQQKNLGDAATNETLIRNLNTLVQEKDDMISNLKKELNSNIEKVTDLIEDNKTLNEQIMLKEEEAKGHANDVIKELGEKISSLIEEIEVKSSQLQECSISLKDKDSKILSLEQSLNDKANVLQQLQNEYQTTCDALKHRESELEEKITVMKSLEGKNITLQSEIESGAEESKKKVILLEDEIKTKSDQIKDYLASIQEKDNLISSLQQNSNAQADILSQLQSQVKELSETLKIKELELDEKNISWKSLEEEIHFLKSQNESYVREKEQKILDLVKEIERLTNCTQEKEDQLLGTQKELTASKVAIEKLNETIHQLTQKLQEADLNLSASNKDSSGKIAELENEISILKQEKDQLKSAYEKELDVFKSASKSVEDELQAKNNIIVQHEAQISTLSEKLTLNEEAYLAQKNDLSCLSEKHDNLCKEKVTHENTLKANEELITAYLKEIDGLKSSLDNKIHDMEQRDKELQVLQDSLNLKEEEYNQLNSKLQLAEQKVDMLNKDSSDHVMVLQNELSKIKEESTATKTHLEQELTKGKNERDKLTAVISEKESILLEKEETLKSLEKSLRDKDSEISDLSRQKEDLLQNITKCSGDIEEQQKKHDEALSKAIAELDTKLVEKEKELSSVRSESEKLLLMVDEKNKLILEKETILMSLQNQLKEKELQISELSNEKANLLINITKFSSDIEEQRRIHQESRSSSEAEYDKKIEEKEQIIQDIQSELKAYEIQLENKMKEFHARETEIKSLKNIVNEKESQFDELTKMIEFSQNQLALLKEQNEKNFCLLQSKESFINDLKTDQENKLQLKEQAFKEEIAELKALIENKTDEVKQKEAVGSELLSELQEQKKLVACLQAELNNAKEDLEKMSDGSSSIYQNLSNKIAEIEDKYSKLLEEKEKIENEEKKSRDVTKSLEVVRDSLMQEKSAQEELVKDREAKLKALQTEVKRMQAEFVAHKEELLQKLDVSEMELQAALELKNQLDIQHSVLEELQQELEDSNVKCKDLEAQIEKIPLIMSEKKQLQTQLEDSKKVDQERSEIISSLESKVLAMEEQLNNNKNLCFEKEKELSDLKDKLQKLEDNKISTESLESLKEENLSLKNKITLLELEKSDKKPNSPAKSITKELSPEDTEEKEFLLNQIDFLNSIIVDMKQKNEELAKQLELERTCWDTSDLNLNDATKVVAPRLFCDICDMFDQHETCDCPKQESFVEEDLKTPQLKLPGTRMLEVRPYCNNCEAFGHWTLDCEEPDTF